MFNVGAILGNTIVAAYIEPSKEAPCFTEDVATTSGAINETFIGKNGLIGEGGRNTTIGSKARALSVGIDAIGTAAGIEKESRGFVADDFTMAFHIPAYITILPVILLFLLQSSRIIEKLTKKQKKNSEKKRDIQKTNEDQAPGSSGLQEEEIGAQVDGDEEEEPKEDFHRIKFFILLLNISLFCNTSTQQVVEAYIYEYSRCSPGK